MTLPIDRAIGREVGTIGPLYVNREGESIHRDRWTAEQIQAIADDMRARVQTKFQPDHQFNQPIITSESAKRIRQSIRNIQGK
jgi:hypothetical protein